MLNRMVGLSLLAVLIFSGDAFADTKTSNITVGSATIQASIDAPVIATETDTTATYKLSDGSYAVFTKVNGEWVFKNAFVDGEAVDLDAFLARAISLVGAANEARNRKSFFTPSDQNRASDFDEKEQQNK